MMMMGCDMILIVFTAHVGIYSVDIYILRDV